MSEERGKDSLSEMSLSEEQSSVSVKSDHSKGGVQPDLNEKKSSSSKSVRSGSHVFSSVSVKSDHSKGGVQPDLSEKKTSSTKRLQYETLDSDVHTHRSKNLFEKDNLLWIFKDLESKIITFLKNELEKFKKILQKQDIQYFVKDFNENRCSIKEAALDLTLYFLREMKQDEAANTLEDELIFVHQLKCSLKKKYQCVFEGIAKQGDSTLLNNIYTDLYITQGCSEQVNTKHEVRQIEVTSRHSESQEIPIECTNMFEAPEQDKQIRTVLTKGVAGIGKSVSVQKFVLDWAEEKENQDISFIFPLPFREMNLKEKEKQSLLDLITEFFPETKGLNIARRNQKVLFILDGLDEFHLPLKFDVNEKWSDVSSPASLDVLLTNLIKGNLLPSALIWITTRPAAASKIPPDCIDRLTEVRGFNDVQKEEYFKKRFEDQNQAKEIIDHVKKSKSLFIMCHIPVVCWISATVLQNILEEKRNNDLENNQANDTSKTLQESNTEDTPKTLTQMYTHFLRFQILQSRRKYDGEYTPDVSWDKDAILSLGKLAFHQLERNNLIFYDTDLEACGIDIYKASVCSGMCTQIFKEETGIILGSMYCFVHLSIQEFIAALYAHLFLDINMKSVFVHDPTMTDFLKTAMDNALKSTNGHLDPFLHFLFVLLLQAKSKKNMTDLLKTAVDKALESDNGHLDLFLRFLLGLSLQSNRRLLRGLLTQQDDNDQSKKEIVQYIKQKLEANLSPERSINLFYCLNELNDQTLVKDIQTHLSKGSLSSSDLSPAQWSALTFVLLTSEEELEEFELQKFKKSDECLVRLLSVIKTSKRALLNDCDLTDRSCSALATVLGSDMNLKELNLNNNNLQDSGVKLLCTGLENIMCELEILRLSDCSITEEGYKALASALRSNPSHLIELDLIGNDPGQSGVKELSDLLQDPNCKLKTVRFLGPVADEACQYVTGIVGKNLLLLRELNLSELELEDTRVNQITALLQDKHCKLNTLILCKCGLTEESCSAVATVLRSNSSLKELDMSNNNLQDSGMKKLQNGLENSNCTLEKLRLSNCSITEEGYKALASALRSNPSHLIELDLTGNDPGQSGVKELSDLLQDPNCQLKTLRFLSPAADEACQYVTGIVGKNPLLLRELNLSEHELGDTRVNQIAALLQDKHCKLNTLILNNSSVTPEDCRVLTEALNSNPSNLIELDLSGNKLGNSGNEKICHLLENTQCKLEKLKLSECSITEEGYKALASALRSNPSHLIELDLTGNDPGQSGVKELNDLLQDECCKSKSIRFLKSPAAQEACDYLTKVLGKSPLLLKELDLSEDKLGDLDEEKFCALLMDSHSKMEKMKLSTCDLTVKSCSALSSVLSSDSSSLKDLDLSNNNLQDSGVRLLSDGLKDNCKLEKLRLSNCSITEEGYKALASALRLNPSHLIELDLTGNDPGQSGVKLLSDLLQDPNCQLKTLRFLGPAADEACQFVTGIVGKNPLLLRELKLSKRELGDTQVNQITALLQDKHCKLNTLTLNNNCITAEGCAALTSAFNSNPSNLTELDLSGNKLGNSGIEKICALFENAQCRLEKLKLSDCSITETGYKDLASALRSNPSHLIELDLTGNDPGQSGVKQLSDLLQDGCCKLKTIRFLKSPAAQEACEYLTEALGKSPLLLTELDLSEDKLGDLGWEKLSALLMDSHSKLEKMKLKNCKLKEQSCSVLSTVLSSKTILKEINMNNSRLLDSGVKEICEGLKNPVCELEILKLSDCSVTEEGYKALASALRSNPSHLIELDLTGNDPGQSGVKQLSDLLQDPNYSLKTLRLLQSPDGEEACKYLTEVLHIKNPLLLRELNLSERELEDTRVNQIAALLRDTHCKLNKLILSDCSITEEGYKALASALRLNPSHLIELDLTGNDPGQSGVKELSDLLQDPNCQLKTLKFLGPAAEEACQYVTGIVGKNPLLLRELNLSERELGDTRVNQISALLQDTHCKLNTLTLKNNSITAEGCAALTSAFNSNPSNLIELDLSGNKLENPGIKKICHLVENKQCRLEKLKLSDCSITEEGYKALSSALRSNPSHLIELDLTGNDPGQSGVKEFIDSQKGWWFTSKTLKTLRFLGPAAEEACQYVTGIVGKNPLLLTELNLSGRELGDTRVNQISALLQDKHCKLKALQLHGCGLTEKSCSALATVLRSNSSLKELDMSNNHLQDPGIKKLQNGLENTNCALQKLRLSDCSITEEGYKALASALRSNPSHLIELDLTGNDPGPSGVKQLSDLLQDKRYNLKTIRFLKSPAAKKACEYLTEVLQISPLLLSELDLSEDKLGDLDGQKLSALLMDSHSKVEKIKLNNCELTEKSCSVLATVLSSKTILKEINMNNSRLLDSGVKEICEGLKNPVCELEILNLSDCSITEEGYKALASALRSNPSHLIELDLTGNEPGQSGVKQLNDLLQDQQCSLKTIRFLKSPAAQEACEYLTEALGTSPLLLKELDLSEDKLGDLGWEKLSALLMDSHSKVEKMKLNNCELTEKSCSVLATVLSSKTILKELNLNNSRLLDSGVKEICEGLKNPVCELKILKLSDCSITEEGYKALASALRSNPSHLIELDLTGNDPGPSGVKELNDLLQDPNYSLKTLRFLSSAADEACQYVTGIVGKNPLLLRELNLSERELGNTRVNQISALLQDKHCTLNTLILRGCSITEKQCLILTSALCSNLSHLRELDLSENKIENKGMKHVSETLKDERCKLERLRLIRCYMTDEGCSALTSALKSNPSHLRELDLSENQLGDSGFKNLSDLLMNPQCKLKILALCLCSITEEECVFLTSALKSNPSHLRELDLSGNKLGDSGVENLGVLLSSSQCRLEKLHLRGCSITEKQCLILTSALKSNLSHLRELDLSENQIENTGVNHLCDVLKDSDCKLERLSLNDCGITDVSSLTQSLSDTKALQFLKELDLRYNMIGDSEQQLSDVLRDSNCKLLENEYVLV
uniref:NACHT domain-containing protein n=1 Tax=Cyprinus carpio carpio TaxID=630221 RepID=A0A8C1DRE0_CYPCA